MNTKGSLQLKIRAPRHRVPENRRAWARASPMVGSVAGRASAHGRRRFLRRRDVDDESGTSTAERRLQADAHAQVAIHRKRAERKGNAGVRSGVRCRVPRSL